MKDGIEMDQHPGGASKMERPTATDGNEEITVAILSGGLGTRLQSSIGRLPKALAPVCDRPFLAYLLDWLSRCGLTRVVLCTGHGAGQIQTFVASYRGPLIVRCSHEASPRGTAGALQQALALIETPYVLALNGDSYCGVHLADFIRWHFERRSSASLVLSHVDDVRRYGRVDIDASGRVVTLIEKSNRRAGGFINAGIYLFHRSLISGIAPQGQVSLEHEVLPDWVRRGLAGFKSGAPFIDIGTPESFQRAQAFFLNWTQQLDTLAVADPKGWLPSRCPQNPGCASRSGIIQ
jgi:D-glycero-alpha-D-manno-heptose 1-phosphate guanylyltransferase